jgi:hypothetical protein
MNIPWLGGFVRLFGLLIVVLMLVLPVSVHAQRTTLIDVAPAHARSTTMKGLVGSWALPGSKELGFTFRADSTLSAATQIPQGKTALTGRWRLAGDTLVVSGVKAKINGKTAQLTVIQRTISFDKKQLTLTRIDDHKPMVYERVDSLIDFAPAASKP